uniref:Myb-like domain-containing protein n=1 Tax=Brassica oleracea var. oleracea TaxID=109376 RepID=A0A0D3B8C6_BRAOL
MNLGGGSRRRFISSVALVVDYSHRWLPFVDYSHRWLPSTNLGGSPRRTTIVRNTFVVSEGMKKEPKDLREILSFFTRKNFNGTDRGETITNNGSEERRRCFAHDLFMYKLACSRSEVCDGCVNICQILFPLLNALHLLSDKHLLFDLLFHLNTLIPLVLLFLSSFTHSDMDYPYTSGSNFVDLLQSQQNVFGSSNLGVKSPVFGTQQSLDRNLGVESLVERRERRKWTPSDDILLISSWLNTSKDPVVGNEQRSGAFWSRVAAYFAASQKGGGCERRDPMHCKQRWQKINDSVCKFCGSYEAATREKTSGQNETDVG